jgi:predicted component of type VI protein secretion system
MHGVYVLCLSYPVHANAEVIMLKEHEESVNPDEPHLIVVYGASKRKHKPLRGDVVVIGRSRSCDIGLVSPEVAPVHCVLLRLANGWRIRDCSGRATRINGRAVHEQMLRDGDVVQVGAFSFEVHLPGSGANPAEPAALPGEIEHLQRSRRRFAERALRFRNLLRQHGRALAEMAQREADLEQLEHRLRGLHREAQVKPARSPESYRTPSNNDAVDVTSNQLEQPEAIRQRIELERLRAEAAAEGRLEGPSTGETWLDSPPSEQLETARKLLRELSESREMAAARARIREAGKQR